MSIGLQPRLSTYNQANNPFGQLPGAPIPVALSPQQSQAVQSLVAGLLLDTFARSVGARGFAAPGARSPYAPLLAAPQGYNPHTINKALSHVASLSQQLGALQYGSYPHHQAASFLNPNAPPMPLRRRFGNTPISYAGKGGSKVDPNAPFSASKSASVEKSKSAQKKETKDRFAVHKACVSNVVGNPSNLNNSEHIALAINDVLKNSKEYRKGKKGKAGFKALKAEDLQKQLKDQYGISSEMTKVKDKKGKEIDALKFENGGVFADGAGDGKLDLGDYNFKGKIADIEKKYGVKADELVKGMKSQKAQLDAFYPGMSNHPGYDTSHILKQGLQQTADRSKAEKAAKEFQKKLQAEYKKLSKDPVMKSLLHNIGQFGGGGFFGAPNAAFGQAPQLRPNAAFGQGPNAAFGQAPQIGQGPNAAFGPQGFGQQGGCHQLMHLFMLAALMSRIS